MEKPVHLGLRQAPLRSTWAYASTTQVRHGELYQTVFEKVLEPCQELKARRKKLIDTSI